MDFDSKRLNPFVRSAAIYERINRQDECVSYDCRVIYMISGDISITCGGQKLGHIGAGNMVYIPAGTPYKLKGQYLKAAVIAFDFNTDYSETEEKLLPVPSAEYDPERLHVSGIGAPFDKVLKLDDMMSDGDEFVKICKFFTSGEGYYLAQSSARFKLLLLKIAEASDDKALPTRMVEALDDYITENCSEEISNTEIGAIFGYHPFYVSNVLKEAKGVTLRQYIISYRLKAAKRLLELTSKSINEIAEETGFTDASYFTKTFRTTFGLTPKDYRNQFKEDFV